MNEEAHAAIEAAKKQDTLRVLDRIHEQVTQLQVAIGSQSHPSGPMHQRWLGMERAKEVVRAAIKELSE